MLAAIGRGGPLGVAVLAVGVAAALLLVIAEFSTLREIDVINASCEDLAAAEHKDACVQTGGEQHGYALVAVALLCLLMAWGAGPGASRPAAAALVVAGAIALAIALLGDLPDIGEEGAVGSSYDQAEARAGPALTLEIAGGALAVLAGAARLALGRAGRR